MSDDLAVRAVADRTQTEPSAIPLQSLPAHCITIKHASCDLSDGAARKASAADEEIKDRVAFLIYENMVGPGSGLDRRVAL